MIAEEKIKLNKETAYLLETLKVESYWSPKNFTLTLQNKDLGLLNKIEEIVNNIGIKTAKRTLIKIRLPENTKKDEIEINWKNKKVSFHIEKNPFDKNKTKAVTSQPYSKRYSLMVTIKNKTSLIEVKYGKNEIFCSGKLEAWAYEDLRFPRKKLFEFMEEKIPKKEGIKVNDYLKEAKKDIVMSAFSALIDCEGTINWYGLKREIQIRMQSKEYLRQWSELLTKFSIGNRVTRKPNKKGNWELNIYGWQDFKKLESLGLNLHHSKKAEKWIRMMEGFKRKQISRGSYREFYVKKLKELNKKVTGDELSKILRKSKRVVNHYLLKLEKEKLICCERNEKPYRYFIST